MPTVRSVSALATGSSTSSLTIPSITTDADTKCLEVHVTNSHGRTISSIQFAGSINLAARPNLSVVDGSNRISVWFVDNPGAASGNIVITFSGVCNPGAFCYDIGESNGTVLDTASKVAVAGGENSDLTLDPTESGALCLYLILRSANTAMVFTGDGTGSTEHIDAAASGGRVVGGTCIADGVTETLGCDVIATNTFAAVAYALQDDAGSPPAGITNLLNIYINDM